jgi:hypothetical protein
MAILVDAPVGKDLEDFVAALLQLGRVYVEKNIVQRDILELDVVTTAYDQDIPHQTLVEVKSGEWGLSDIFKVAGWMKYLNMKDGAFVVTKCPTQQLDSIDKVSADLGIKLVVIDDFAKSAEIMSSKGFNSTATPYLHWTWRYSFWVERQLLDILRMARKNNESMEAPRRALEYYDLVNHGIFFRSSPVNRVSHLYEAYASHPKLTLGAASELAGTGYNPETPSQNNTFLKEAMHEGKHPILQACMYLEHRARLSILKNAVECICKREAGEIATDSSGMINLHNLPISILPQNFRNGLETIAVNPNYRLFPLFWQVFLWGWGGFILTDRIDEEYSALAEQTGLTKEEIPKALDLMDLFFPQDKKWFWQNESVSYRLVKMVPTGFQGIGAYQRRLRHKLAKYNDLGYKDYTGNDLAKWETATARLLEKE